MLAGPRGGSSRWRNKRQGRAARPALPFFLPSRPQGVLAGEARRLQPRWSPLPVPVSRYLGPFPAALTRAPAPAPRPRPTNPATSARYREKLARPKSRNPIVMRSSLALRRSHSRATLQAWPTMVQWNSTPCATLAGPSRIESRLRSGGLRVPAV